MYYTSISIYYQCQMYSNVNIWSQWDTLLLWADGRVVPRLLIANRGSLLSPHSSQIHAPHFNTDVITCCVFLLNIVIQLYVSRPITCNLAVKTHYLISYAWKHYNNMYATEIWLNYTLTTLEEKFSCASQATGTLLSGLCPSIQFYIYAMENKLCLAVAKRGPV